MTEHIIFQHDRLTVYETKLSVGNATVFYPSISASNIYEGRPLLTAGIMGIVGLCPTAFMLFLGSRLFGPYFPTGIMAIMLIPMIVLIAVGFLYQVKCLFLSIDGRSVVIMKSNDRVILETAQRAIEHAKTEYHKRNTN